MSCIIHFKWKINIITRPFDKVLKWWYFQQQQNGGKYYSWLISRIVNVLILNYIKSACAVDLDKVILGRSFTSVNKRVITVQFQRFIFSSAIILFGLQVLHFEKEVMFVKYKSFKYVTWISTNSIAQWLSSY